MPTGQIGAPPLVKSACFGKARHVLRLGVLFLCLPTPTLGQSTLATIRGTVFDPQRRVVQAARITVVDESTSVPRTSDSSPTGDYQFTNLRPGSYRLEAIAPGFKTFLQSGLTLRGAETVRLDVTLELGATATTVTVTADPPPLNLESSAIQGGLEAQQLRTLPRNLRDIRSFLYLNPNVVGDRDHGFQFLGGRTYGASYVQDGQPSTGGIFANITNAAPGLEAVAEVKVLTNSYSAEYGGLAGVLVTTRRGSNRYAGTAFYDFNADELNARTYAQTLAGLERGFSGSNTYDRRYGVLVGGPVKRERTFFLVNYEGSDRTEVGSGSIVTVPTDRMRLGDFSANSFTIRDPETGQPFPGNIIPPHRVSQTARNVLDFFYPRAHLPPLANGVGRYQEFVNLSTTRDRWDGRVDHEVSRSDSLFVRMSWQRDNPGTSFENASLPRLGTLDRRLAARTAAASWMRSFSTTRLNELRGGYMTDRSNRKSRFIAGEVAGRLGLEIPATGNGRRGYSAFTFQGSNTIRSIADPSVNADRDTRQTVFSLSDTFTWLRGRHSLRMGGLYARNAVLDGFSTGVSGGAGSFVFSGAFTGNSFADFLLGLPARSDEGITTRGQNPLDARAHELAAFLQDDWRLGSAVTVFLGIRYEVLGPFVERNDLLINFDPDTGSLIIPDERIRNLVAPDAARLLPVELAKDRGVGRSLVNADKNNFSPRVGFAYRLGSKNEAVIRGGAGLFYPTNAAQGIRDALSRSPFRFARRRLNPAFDRAFSTGLLTPRSIFGVNAVDVTVESAEALQYHLTIERELTPNIAVRASYLGTRFRKLLVNNDLNTAPPGIVPFDPQNETDRQRLPYPALGNFLLFVDNAASGWFQAFQVEARRRFAGGLSFNAAYTWAGSETTAPDLGNSTLGVVQYNPYDLSMDRGPDPDIVTHRFIADSTWELPIGRGRRRLTGLPAWADVLIGGWTVSTIFQARSGNHLTPFFQYGTDPIFPANTGKAYDTNNSFQEAWRPDVVGNPNGSTSRNTFFNLAAFRLPAPGTVGNARKGLLTGPGTWVVNVGLYKTIVHTGRYHAEFRAVLDNAFNHPQFFITHDSGFLNLTDFLINGVPENGTTNVLREVGSVEGFAAARVIRVGVRVAF